MKPPGAVDHYVQLGQEHNEQCVACQSAERHHTEIWKPFTDWAEMVDARLQDPDDKTHCIACNKEVDDLYMVRDDVWQNAGWNKGVAHLECLERKLERPLALEDFDESLPVNKLIFFGARLA